LQIALRSKAHSTSGITIPPCRYGKWKLVNEEAVKLVLTGIKAGEIIGKKRVSFPIYRTAPTVVRIRQPQFVFAVKAKETATDSGGNDEVRSADPQKTKSK
jgi:hypothetical protein